MPTSYPILRQVSLAIAISAIAAPAASAASARSSSQPSPTAHSQTTATSLVVRPNPDQQISQAGVVVRPNPDQQTGQSGSRTPQSPRAPRALQLTAHNRTQATMRHRRASQFATGNTPRGVAIGAHRLKRTVNDRDALTRTFAQTHSTTAHALYRQSSLGAGGASLSTLKANGAADSAPVAAPAITAPSDDFDYGAAALGAGITAAIAMLIAAGTLGLRQRSRTRHL